MEKKHRWWKEPMVWLLISLPLTAVVAGFTTAWIAARGADTLVSDDFQKDGFALHQTGERDQKARELGLVATINTGSDGLKLALSGRLSRQPEMLTLSLVHPTQATKDIVIVFRLQTDGHYLGAPPDAAEGKRQAILEPTDKTWRLTGQWARPLTDHLTLSYGSTDSPPPL